VRFEGLPEIPKIWIDFLNSKLSFLPAGSEMPALSDRATAVQRWAGRNTELLNKLAHGAAPGLIRMVNAGKRGHVAVALSMKSGLFAPISQLLKCLTAIRICQELATLGIPAVPVCCVSVDASPTPTSGSLNLLDSESEIHTLKLPRDLQSNEPIPEDQITNLLSRIEDLGHGSFDREAIEAIRSAFIPAATASSASAQLLAALMKEWEMVVLDEESPAVKPILQEALLPIAGRISGNNSSLLSLSLTMPVIAHVVSPAELHSFAHAMTIFAGIGLPRPAAWPQASATLLDARSRRALKRFSLDLLQLYSGEEQIVERIGNAMPRLSTEKFAAIESEVEALMTEVSALSPSGNGFAKAAGTCREKILYQLRKVQINCRAVENRKLQVMRRQIHMLCNFLAPNRRLQENEIGGIQIPLRYSGAGLRLLCEKLDILKPEHQLISMD
jgi:hypothetical protein